MSALFHSIRVKEVRRETTDAASVVFDIPDELKSTFSYLPGQYITVKVMINGKEERRAYSFSSSPITDEYPAITVKKVDGGAVSPYLNDQVQAGQVLELMPPMGKFTAEVSGSQTKQYMLFGGGSGITPVISILKTVLQEEPNSIVKLIYANRDEASIIFKAKLNELATTYADRLSVFHGLDEAPANFDGHAGRMSAEDYANISAKLEVHGYDNEYYICGPSGMMDQVKKGLEQRNIPETKIHTEYFTTPVNDTPKPSPAPNSTLGSLYGDEEEEHASGEKKATILFNGEEFEINIPEGTTILEAAKDQDVDPPYACQMGVCTTCRAKVLEGSANMDEREGLSDAEVDEGYILTCQAHPTSARIKLIYE